MNKNSTQLRVSKDNALIDASYRLSLTEMQIILYGIGLVNPLQPDFPLSYRIEIERFAKMFNRGHGQIYQEVKDAVVKRFWERDFSYTDEKGKIVTLRWLTKMVHQDKTGYIEIKFSEEVQPYLYALQKNFTSYYIDKISKFKSAYSIRFYEKSIMLLNKGKVDQAEFQLPINELKVWLNLNSKYERFCNLKSRVLEKAKKEINEFSDIELDYIVIKIGRSPYKINFLVNRKEKSSYKTDSIDKNKVIENIRLPNIIIEKAKEIILKKGSRWDVYAIEDQFYRYIKKKGVAPNSISGAFIKFVEKKITSAP